MLFPLNFSNVTLERETFHLMKEHKHKKVLATDTLKILLFYFASYHFSFLFSSLMYICFACSIQHRLPYWHLLFTMLFSVMYVKILTNLFSYLCDGLQIISSNIPGEKKSTLKSNLPIISKHFTKMICIGIQKLLWLYPSVRFCQNWNSSYSFYFHSHNCSDF